MTYHVSNEQDALFLQSLVFPTLEAWGIALPRVYVEQRMVSMNYACRLLFTHSDGRRTSIDWTVEEPQDLLLFDVNAFIESWAQNELIPLTMEPL